MIASTFEDTVTYLTRYWPSWRPSHWAEECYAQLEDDRWGIYERADRLATWRDER